MTEPGAEAVTPRFVSGPDLPIAYTLSLWRDLKSVFGFSYGGLHADALRLRHE